MEFENENAPPLKPNRLLAIVLVIVIVHLGVFIAYYYFPRPWRGLFPKDNFQTPKSSDRRLSENATAQSRYSSNPSSIQIENPQIYSWTGSDGVMHFSNIPPQYAVNDLKVKNEVISDDLGSSEIIARRIDPFPSKSRTSRVVIKGNQVLVPVRLGFNGSEIQTLLVLDTGATITTVHREVALRLNAKKTYQSNSRVADGRTISSEIAELDYIIVGPHKHTNFKVSIINYQGEKEDSAGLLGMNFIKHASYKINYKNETIEWEL